MKDRRNAPKATAVANDDDMPAEIDFSGGVRGLRGPMIVAQAMRAERYRQALEHIRDVTAEERDPREAVRRMREYAAEALAS